MKHMAKLSFSPSEIATMKLLNHPTNQITWGDDTIKSIKSKLKDYHYAKQNKQCCYCRTTLPPHKMSYDLEHILPISHPTYKKHTITNKNLSIACKRCNSTIKRHNTDFLATNLPKRRMFKSKYYKIIHPNLDKYDAHMNRIECRFGNSQILAFKILSNKGRFSYTYFRLNELETENIHSQQGIEAANRIIQRIMQNIQ